MDSVSDEDLAFGKLLLSERPEPEAAEPETEPEADAPAPRRSEPQKTATEVAPGAFDAAAVTGALVSEIGETAKPAVERLTGAIGQHDQTIRQHADDIATLSEQLQSALEAIKDLGGKVDPLSEWAGAVQSAQQAAQASEVHQWFDTQEGYADRYGKGDPNQHTSVQRAFRQAIFNDARDIVQKAAAKGRNIPLAKAMAMAQQISFGNPTKQGAVDAVRSQVKQQARGLSIDPARGGKSAAPLTPEQEHADNVKTVAAILARARNGDRK